jgi:hypothetical protein
MLSNFAFKFNSRRYNKERAAYNLKVGADGQYSPRHQTHFEPSFLEFDGIL